MYTIFNMGGLHFQEQTTVTWISITYQILGQDSENWQTCMVKIQVKMKMIPTKTQHRKVGVEPHQARCLHSKWSLQPMVSSLKRSRSDGTYLIRLSHGFGHLAHYWVSWLCHRCCPNSKKSLGINLMCYSVFRLMRINITWLIYICCIIEYSNWCVTRFLKWLFFYLLFISFEKNAVKPL